jgi:prevent-host-death family protein
MAWQVQDAKARFSELLDETLEKGPQVVTKRGVETAVLVSIKVAAHAGLGKAFLEGPLAR